MRGWRASVVLLFCCAELGAGLVVTKQAQPEAHRSATLRGGGAPMLTLSQVFSAHRFIAGPFGVALLGFPTELNQAMAMGRDLPAEERFCLQVCLWLLSGAVTQQPL